MKEVYLGDGVYATFDGYCIWLDCRAQPELSRGPAGFPGVALEPAVMDALIRFAASCAADTDCGSNQHV